MWILLWITFKEGNSLNISLFLASHVLSVTCLLFLKPGLLGVL